NLFGNDLRPPRVGCHLQLSLTILRFVTRMSPASAASFFSCSSLSLSPFSFSYDSALKLPVMVTLWPKCFDLSASNLSHLFSAQPTSPVRNPRECHRNREQMIVRPK